MKEPDVDGLSHRLTAKQFRNWEIYDSLEPIGGLRGDYQAAQIAAMIYNRSRGKDQRALTINDCLLPFHLQLPKPQQTWQQMKSMAYMIALAYNAEGKTE